MIHNSIQCAFFGVDGFSVIVLEELKKAGYLPALIVTAPDKPAGRGMRLAAPPTKIWAQENKIELFQPEKLNEDTRDKIQDTNPDIFVVASYGKIIPKDILEIPEHGALNVHPSLLPLYRGPSPIQSQILDGTPETGTTIMKMDNEMDHGPIVAQELLPDINLSTVETLPSYTELRDSLARLGGELLAETVPDWLAGNINPQEQEHEYATYTKKIAKDDGRINLKDTAEKNYRKFKAFTPWPGVYFFTDDGTRVKITDALWQDNAFVIKKVIPEGKQEMDYKTFQKQKPGA